MILHLTLVLYSFAQICTIIIPDDPLSSIGLQTPYIYKNCDQTVTPSFVEAVILNKYTGELGIYTPLIINENTQPFIKPKPVIVNDDHIVGIWFGSNADTIILENKKGSKQLTTYYHTLPNHLNSVKKK